MSDKQDKISRRAFFLLCIKSIFYTILGVNFYNLQIGNSNKYSLLADKNRIRVNVLQAPRGLIFDRNGKILVDNKVLYSVILDKEMLSHLEEISSELKKIIPKSKIETKFSKNEPITLLTNLKWEDIAKIESNLNINSIVRIVREYRRDYLYGNDFSHITGYIGAATKKELEEATIPNYKDFLFGKNGAEMSFNDELFGKPGVQKVEVNAFGSVIREINNQQSIQGDKINLSIDAMLQQKIIELAERKNGVYMVMNIKTGEIVAMYSPPGYDPNIFVGRIKQDAWNAIVNSPEKVLMNKAISSSYPPGSIFKMIVMLAILQGGIPPERTVNCTGEYRIGRRIFHCWKEYGHGNINGYNALQHSCNIYFAVNGLNIGIDAISSMAYEMGFGEKTNIELPFEVSGLVPTKDWKQKRYKKPWTHGDTVNTTIGQGFVLTTPIQLLLMVARIAAEKYVAPTILFQKENYDFSTIRNISREHFDIVKKNLQNLMEKHNYGGLKIAGKTSTIQVISNRKATGKFKDHSAFVGFAPYDDPQYAVLTIVENGGWGYENALPLAKKIFSEILGKSI